ncbi:serpin family protein [Arundinibacter roseus]|uniref:Serpin family protein n=1 Tax=Arundinibacter roseus TaxID=2070510 RepID=A0A4R4KQD4_9BACT|nr:serpin family protein [Arundinibacter roseus]TDB69176.1 serpin family protein [Arundinibacter roseus]
MKQNFFVLLGATIFTLFLGRCTTDDSITPPTGTPVEIAPQIAGRTNEFAFDFFKNVKNTQPAEDNVFVSPLSLHMALGMLLHGAEGETAEQINQTLKMAGVSEADLRTAYQALLKGLPKADSRVNLGLANSMWYRNTFAVQNDFQNVLRESFDAEVTSLDFNSPSAKDKINQWASDKTYGKIPQVIEKIEPEHVLFLLNALYFKGDWKYQFDASKTGDAMFRLANDQEKSVKMMRLKEDFRVAQRPGYSAIELPYSTGQFALTLLIPNEDATANDVIQNLSATAWDELQKTYLQKANVEVGLPRFTLDYEINLNSTLQAMGMTKAFSSAAELGKINPSAPLAVSFVKQNTFLGIDEKGTEAAAVTTIGVELTSAPINPYICDRPFVMILSEKTSNTILFMGRIMNPESGK